MTVVSIDAESVSRSRRQGHVPKVTREERRALRKPRSTPSSGSRQGLGAAKRSDERSSLRPRGDRPARRGPEDVAIDAHGQRARRPRGRAHPAHLAGRARTSRRVAETGGRPLGIEIDPDGELLVCDARRGVLRVDPRTGGRVDAARRPRSAGEPMMFCNNGALGRRRHDLLHRQLPAIRHRPLQGRAVRPLRHRAVVPPHARRGGRPGGRRAAVRQRRRARAGRVVDRGRARPAATASTGSG